MKFVNVCAYNFYLIDLYGFIVNRRQPLFYGTPHGVQGVVSSNPTVPTSKIKGLQFLAVNPFCIESEFYKLPPTKLFALMMNHQKQNN